MKLIIVALLTGFISTLVYAEEKVNITCYPSSADRDGDGYARDGTGAVTLSVSKKNNRYTCPAGYVPDENDCNDNNSAVHPYRYEIASNNRDDNCNDQADENEFVYFPAGNNNEANSFEIRVKVNNQDVLDKVATSYPIYAKVRYRKVNTDTDTESGYKRVTIGSYYHSKLGSYRAAEVSLSGLSKTSVYRARVKFYYKDGGKYKSLGLYGKNVYYTSTSHDTNKVSIARTGILLRGFTEYFYQQLGLVGRNGSRWINGTRYDADVNEAWCTEFYSYAAKSDLDGSVYPISNTTDMKKFFGSNFVRVYNDIDDLDAVRRADWLAIDWEGDNKMDHTAMFLGKLKNGKILTLEGNTGNRVKVKERKLEDIYGYGRIRTSNID